MRQLDHDGYADRLDDAARAAWLYYFAGYTQERIARYLGVSRQTAQRMISLALREKLVRIRMEHPILRCMELSHAMTTTFGLKHCEVVPSDPQAPQGVAGLAQAAAVAMERALSCTRPLVVSVGTGRSLRAAVEDLEPMNRPQHLIVARLGHMMPDGLATPFNVVVRLADRINASHYPMPLPIYARNARERALYAMLDPVRQIHDLSARADVTFMGIGNIGPDGPLSMDGFMSQDEVAGYIDAGAVGEVTGWIFDAEGRLIEGLANDRVNSVPLRQATDSHPIHAVAAGVSKAAAIRAAIRGGFINCLVTNEATAEAVLALEGAVPQG